MASAGKSGGEGIVFLYDHPVSSYAQKIRIALRYKNVPFTAKVPEDLSAHVKDGPFATANPRAEVPVLLDGSLSVFDSTIIMEYIEDRWPEPAMLPRDPASRANARLIEEVCDTHYEAINWGVGEIRWFKRAEGAKAEEMLAQAKHHTGVIQEWLSAKLAGNDRQWLTGERFGWADICAAPMVNRSVSYGWGPAEGSPLAAWHKRLKDVPAVAQTFAEFEEAAPNMPKAAPLYQSGQRKREYRDHRLEWMVKAGGVDVVVEGLKKNNIRFAWPDNE